MQIDWSKDGIPLHQTGLPHHSYITHYSNQLLAFSDVTPAHAGLYRCKAFLRQNPERFVTAEAYVSVKVKPSVEGPEPETVSELGHDVILPCQATGQPLPNIKWIRNSLIVGNQPVDRYEQLENGSLRISNLKAEDSGIFQCLIENSAGDASVYTWLHVKCMYCKLLNLLKQSN